MDELRLLRYRAEGCIWQVRQVGDQVALEVREPQSRRMWLETVSLTTAALLARFHSPGDAWMHTLAAADARQVYLHGYANPQMPQPKGLFAYTWAGKLAWQLPRHALLDILPSDRLLLLEPLGESDAVQAVADAATGELLGSPTDLHRLDYHQPADAATAEAPVTVLPTDAAYPAIATRLHTLLGWSPVHVLELLQPGAWTWIAAYEGRTDGDLRQHLLGIHGGAVRVHLVLLDRTQAVVPGAFHRQAGWLLAVQEKHELVAIRF